MSVVASVQRVPVAGAASARRQSVPASRAARLPRIAVHAAQQEGAAAPAAAAAASFSRLEEILDDYRRAPPSVVRGWQCVL